jgi:hypothetical protein
MTTPWGACISVWEWNSRAVTSSARTGKADKIALGQDRITVTRKQRGLGGTRERIANIKRDRRSRHGEDTRSGEEPSKENPCSGRRRHERVEAVAEKDRCRNLITHAHYAFERNTSRVGGCNATATEQAGSVARARGGDSTDGTQAGRGSVNKIALYKPRGVRTTNEVREQPAEEAADRVSFTSRRDTNSHARRKSRRAVLEYSKLDVHCIGRQVDSV